MIVFVIRLLSKESYEKVGKLHVVVYVILRTLIGIVVMDVNEDEKDVIENKIKRVSITKRRKLI